MKSYTIGFFSLLVILFGFTFSNAFGEISSNSAFILEGSGFAVTEDVIKISEIDLSMSTQQQTGSTTKSTIEDGFVTLDDLDFLATKLQATFLREGKYFRINGNVENDSGEEASVRFFGRLIEESKTASVYGITGRITNGEDSYKIIYTTKISTLSKLTPTPTESKTEKQLIIHIQKGASTRGLDTGYGAAGSDIRLRYFSSDRISVDPGTTITLVNDDVVSHNIKSGQENYGDRYNQYTFDGRISTGEILPGQSITITFDDAGFYRLYDPDYQWMNIIAYVFPNADSLNLGTQAKPKN